MLQHGFGTNTDSSIRVLFSCSRHAHAAATGPGRLNCASNPCIGERTPGIFISAAVQPKALKDNLHHLTKSLKLMPHYAIITPSSCRKCGFINHMDRLHRPGKCLSCNGTWISKPLISIEERR